MSIENVTFRIKKWNPLTGYIYTDTENTYPVSTELTTYKVADLTGVFIPNEYKVTPYSAFTKAIGPKEGAISFAWRYTLRESLVYDYTLTGDYCLFQRGFTPWESHTSTRCTAIKEEALLRAFGKVGDLSQLDLGTELGELRETWGMLWHTIHRAVNSREAWSSIKTWLKAESEIDGQDIKHALTGLPGKYMEFRYGWMPLMRSVHSAYELFIDGLRKLEAGGIIHTARGSSKFVRTLKESVYGGIPSAYMDSIFENKVEGKAKAYVHYRIKNTPNLADLLGVSPKFIPETAWALTKCSFVWDWFLTLGPWLQAVRTLISGDFEILGNCVTTTLLHKGEIKNVLRSPSAPKDPFYAIINGKRVDRVINQTVPTPGVRYSKVLDIWNYIDLLLIGANFLPKSIRRQLKQAFLENRSRYLKYTE